MSWEKLRNFDHIIDRKDFSYVVSEKHTDAVKLSMQNIATHADEGINAIVEFLEEYYAEYCRFLEWLHGHGVHDFDMAKRLGRRIQEVIGPLKSERRESIPVRKCKALWKDYCFAMNRLLAYLRGVFLPDTRSNNKPLTKEQLATYILDDREGLGRMNTFNTVGSSLPQRDCIT